MKSHLKLLILILSLQALPLAVFADYHLLFYEQESGTQCFECWLSDKPILSFNHADNTLTVTVSTQGLSQTLEFSKMGIKLKEENKPTGIEGVMVGPNTNTLELQFVDAQTVVVKGKVDNISANLYSLDGKDVSADIEHSSSQLTFHLNSLPQGVYIIRIGQQSFKVFKKL